MDYTDICFRYGITESALDEYLYLNEDADSKYQAYVERCKRKGIPIMSQEAYARQKKKVITGLAAGAAAIGAVGLATSKKGQQMIHNSRMKALEYSRDYDVQRVKNNREYKKALKKKRRAVRRAKYF